MHVELPINISLVCANSIVSQGLKRILDEDNFVVEGLHHDTRAFLASSPHDKPDECELILIDVSAARNLTDEVTELRELLPHSRLVLLHDDLEVECLIEAFQAGADGYILKEIACESLLSSLRLVALGEKVVPGKLVEQLSSVAMAANNHARAETEISKILSEREIETLHCLVKGYPNKIIARRLEIGEATVKVHVKAILRKLMVQNRTQAAIWAVNRGVSATGIAHSPIVAASSTEATSCVPNKPQAALVECQAA